MKPHDTYLQLAAIAIDYPLAPAERGRLEAHVAACPACARSAHGFRADAMAFGNLPAVTLPERRGAEILHAAMHPATVRHPLRLVLVAALLALLALGSFAAGAELLRRSQDDLSVVVPLVATASPGPDASPAPNLDSPLGTLVVTHGDGGTEWIELLTMDGATTRLAEGRDPAWLSANLIVYTCGSPDGPAGICAVDPGAPGQPQIRLAEGDRPAPAPDGSSIAIHRGMIDVGETWIMGADGSGARRLAMGAFLEWSPDGAWLAGQPETPGNAEVAIIGADGKGFRVLAPGYDPAWSPSGDRIAYASFAEQGASLRTVDLSTGEIAVLVTTPAGSEVDAPAWLADGRLLFVQDGNIRLFDPAQTAPVQVTTGAAISGGASTDPLAVSPYGGWVAYTTGIDTGALVELANLAGNRGMSFPWTGPVTQPAWAPKVTPPIGEPGTSPAPLGWSWEDATMPAAVGVPVGRPEAVTVGGIGFLAVGRGCLIEGDTGTCEGIVWRSADGKTWDRVPGSDATNTGFVFRTSGPEIGMYDVALGGSGFVAIGYAARPTMEATTWFSPDGVTWERNPLGDVGSTRVMAVAWDGQQLVLVGEDRSDWDGTAEGFATAEARAAVWTSTDGRTWTRVPHTSVFDVGGFVETMEDPITGGMSDIVAGPAGMVAVGSTCTREGACQPAAWTTTTGSGNAWERVTDMQGLSGVLKAVAATDSGYVAVGAGTCGSSPVAIPQDCPAVIMQSSDAQTWRLQPEVPVSDLRTVTRIGDWFFATATGGQETVWVSADGKSWAPLEAEGGPLTDDQGVGVKWRFGADDVTAVWLGVSGADAPAAWVSSP